MGEIVENYENMSTLLNDYFLAVFTQDDQTNIPDKVQIYEGGDDDKLGGLNMTKQVVQNDIDKLKRNKSPGPDGIFPRVLHECKEVLSDPLTDILKMSVNTGYVPSLWKIANVTPIFKK